MNFTTRSRSSRLGAALLCAASCLVPASALAEQPGILLVTIPAGDGGWPKAEQRARAELIALGLPVRLAAQPQLSDCSDNEATRSALRRADALGALELRLLPGNKRLLRVCVVELVTGKAALRHIEVTPTLQPAQAALLAVELVHASLLEVRAPHPSRGQVKAPPQIRKTVDRQLRPSPGPWLSVRLGGAVFAGPGGISPSVAPGLGLTLRPTPRLALEADAALSLLPGRAASQHGAATTRLGLARTHVVYSVLSRNSFGVGLGIGAGFAGVQVRGEANPPFRAAAGVATTWFVSSALGAGLALTPEWWLRLDGHVGFAPEPISVGFAGSEAVRLGQPLFDGGLSLEWRALR